eukprot:GHVP01001608.1.p1 GENE.GHVP01001608.1~~GHVP01001608.1.p1  ORF type:complete len:392 (+),score=64.80 GHVP01001608.1:17-1192(+)
MSIQNRNLYKTLQIDSILPPISERSERSESPFVLERFAENENSEIKILRIRHLPVGYFYAIQLKNKKDKTTSPLFSALGNVNWDVPRDFSASEEIQVTLIQVDSGGKDTIKPNTERIIATACLPTPKHSHTGYRSQIPIGNFTIDYFVHHRNSNSDINRQKTIDFESRLTESTREVTPPTNLRIAVHEALNEQKPTDHKVQERGIYTNGGALFHKEKEVTSRNVQTRGIGMDSVGEQKLRYISTESDTQDQLSQATERIAKEIRPVCRDVIYPKMKDAGNCLLESARSVTSYSLHSCASLLENSRAERERQKEAEFVVEENFSSIPSISHLTEEKDRMKISQKNFQSKERKINEPSKHRHASHCCCKTHKKKVTHVHARPGPQCHLHSHRS